MTTGEIRRIIYDRQGGRCLACDEYVTWKQAHLHERVPRGQGGEISRENSEILCSYCHLNVAHGDRRPQFYNPKERGII